MITFLLSALLAGAQVTTAAASDRLDSQRIQNRIQEIHQRTIERAQQRTEERQERLDESNDAIRGTGMMDVCTRIQYRTHQCLWYFKGLTEREQRIIGADFPWLIDNVDFRAERRTRSKGTLEFRSRTRDVLEAKPEQKNFDRESAIEGKDIIRRRDIPQKSDGALIQSVLGEEREIDLPASARSRRELRLEQRAREREQRLKEQAELLESTR